MLCFYSQESMCAYTIAWLGALACFTRRSAKSSTMTTQSWSLETRPELEPEPTCTVTVYKRCEVPGGLVRIV